MFYWSKFLHNSRKFFWKNEDFWSKDLVHFSVQWILGSISIGQIKQQTEKRWTDEKKQKELVEKAKKNLKKKGRRFLNSSEIPVDLIPLRASFPWTRQNCGLTLHMLIECKSIEDPDMLRNIINNQNTGVIQAFVEQLKSNYCSKEEWKK